MFAPMFLNLGFEFVNQGRLTEAEKAFRQAIEADPGYEKAYSNLGFVLYRQNRLVEAEAYLLQAVKLRPGCSAYNNLALVYMDTNRLAEAEASLRQGIKINNKIPELYNNLGLVLEEDGFRQKEAEQAYRKAIKLKPDYAEAYYNLGNFFKNTHRLGNAENAYLRALKIFPGYKDARFALASLYLLRGQFDKGWQSYNELRMAKTSIRRKEIPFWQGEDLAGKRILLFYEQGFGDTLQFVRYASLVARSADHAVLWVQKPLESLLKASFADITVYTGEQHPDTHFDFACPLPDLPMLFHTGADNILKEIPYVRPDADVAEKWQDIMKKSNLPSQYRVGVVWQGNYRHHNDVRRSIPFDRFAQLFANTQVTWVSLQVEQQSAKTEATVPLQHFENELTNFAQTAGLIQQLDLVITVDSAVAHLAGAMGKETWVLLPYLPDWRWQLMRKDSPWYPTIRLFRQMAAGDWQSVLQEVKGALADKILLAK